VGQDESIKAYRLSQKKIADELGVEFRAIDLKSDITFQDLELEIRKLNEDESITGIIINKPFPFGSEEDVFSLIDESKDVEGVNPANLGKLFLGNKGIADVISETPEAILLPPTVGSVLDILFLALGDSDIYGKKVTIVGFSSIIGKPLALLLANSFATVSIAHIATYEKGDLASYVKGADILISAVGEPDLIKGAWIKEGAIVIDVGTSKNGNEITGDVEFEEASRKAAIITPVPGGVGKLTTLFLYHNLMLIRLRRKG
jgi:methylenetetrahydrofolate dehydrogenase (NADP+)/methenyltetrahydrofolate cyclohydrolase